MIHRALLREHRPRLLPHCEQTTTPLREPSAGLPRPFTAIFPPLSPTALFLDETPIVLAAQQFLARRRLRVPEEVSLIAEDPDACFQWCDTTLAHIVWRNAPVIRRIVQWANALSEHRTDVRQVTFEAEFIPGGTIGPVRKG